MEPVPFKSRSTLLVSASIVSYVHQEVLKELS